MLASMSQRAYIYCRISSDRDADEAGITRQENDGRALCASRSIEVAQVFTDNDISATHGTTRPGYKDMLSGIKSGDADTIVIYHLSRLWRNRGERATGIELLKTHHVTILAAKGPDLDLSTAYGRAMAGLLGEFDTMESEVKSERIKTTLAAKADQGRPHGGTPRPFGYEEDRVTVRPDEAAVVREAAERVLSGEPTATVARDLNARGVRTARGTLWSYTKLKRVLVSARIAGLREHQPGSSASRRKRAAIGEIKGPARWAAIISEAQSKRLRMLLTDPARRVSTAPNGRYMLSGLVRCSRCGYRMVGRPRGDGAGRYVCDGATGKLSCGKTFILASHLEDYVLPMVIEALDTQGYRRELSRLGGAESEDLVLAAIRDTEQELEELAADYGQGRISRREWMAARGPLESRLNRHSSVLSRSDAARALAALPEDREGLERFFATAPPPRRKAALAAAIASITIHPAVKGRNFFDPGRVAIEWRA